MNSEIKASFNNWPTLKELPVPAKVLVTAIILTMNIAMGGAMGQIIIHDIIPTFFSEKQTMDMSEHHSKMMGQAHTEKKQPAERGDLFGDLEAEPVVSMPFYQTEQFVWTLKWTHIHLFGINMIFIFMGAITMLMDIELKKRTWLIILPFVGILIDISTMWLKAYISPAFFWLHLPGGGLMGGIFGFVTIRGLWELWGYRWKI